MTTEIITPQSRAGSSLQLTRSHSEDVPEWMRSAELADVNKTMDQYVTPPRIKQVQGTSKPPVSDRYSPGDVCLVPTLDLVAKKGEIFTVVPLYFFPEWLETNPIEADVFIRDRSFDPKSLIAAKARDQKRWREPWDQAHGGSDATKSIRFTETLNFIIAIVNHPELTGMVASLGFARSEHKTGSSWSTSIRFRRLPMFGQVWDLRTSQRTNNKGAWYGFNPQQHPEDGGLVMDKDAFEQFKGLHDTYREAHMASRLQVNVDDRDEIVAESETTEF